MDLKNAVAITKIYKIKLSVLESEVLAKELLILFAEAQQDDDELEQLIIAEIIDKNYNKTFQKAKKDVTLKLSYLHLYYLEGRTSVNKLIEGILKTKYQIRIESFLK